ncbi:MAG TPA: hypothetical protein DIT58_01810 [Porticoccaceae bacterium]|nr:hypothetical protein [Porticoccaceae bacterium]
MRKLFLSEDVDSLPLTDVQKEAIRSGKAWLLVTDDPNQYLVIKMTESNGEKSLYIWHAEGIGWIGAMEVIEQIAKAAGAVSIKFGTNRRGWERRAAHYGFSPEKVIYSREVL